LAEVAELHTSNQGGQLLLDAVGRKEGGFSLLHAAARRASEMPRAWLYAGLKVMMMMMVIQTTKRT